MMEQANLKHNCVNEARTLGEVLMHSREDVRCEHHRPSSSYHIKAQHLEQVLLM